jgi:AcrR family transcriptional regulator
MDDPGPAEGTSGPRRWESHGRQPRSQATQDALLDSAEALFASAGIDATAVTDVALGAKRSIGSLYHHFQNKETLVLAVVDRVLRDLEAVIETPLKPSHWHGLGIPDIVRNYVQTALAIERSRPGYKRILVEVGLHDAQTLSAYKRFRRRLDGGLTQLLLDRRENIGHPDPDTAARFAVDQLSAMLWARLDRVMTPTQLEDCDDEAFTAEAIASVNAYLRLRE